jgi:hypothetical protein
VTDPPRRREELHDSPAQRGLSTEEVRFLMGSSGIRRIELFDDYRSPRPLHRGRSSVVGAIGAGIRCLQGDFSFQTRSMDSADTKSGARRVVSEALVPVLGRRRQPLPRSRLPTSKRPWSPSVCDPVIAVTEPQPTCHALDLVLYRSLQVNCFQGKPTVVFLPSANSSTTAISRGENVALSSDPSRTRAGRTKMYRAMVENRAAARPSCHPGGISASSNRPSGRSGCRSESNKRGWLFPRPVGSPG